MTSPVFFSMFISVALTCIILLIPTVYLMYSLLGYYSLAIFPILYYLNNKEDKSRNEKFTKKEKDVAEILVNLSKSNNDKGKNENLRRSKRIENKEIKNTANILMEFSM